jgi:hypothetical protein
VLFHWTRVLRSSYVIRSSGEHSPVDTDDVIASSQKIWKENSTCLQSLLFPRYYKIFLSVLTVWLVLKLLDLRLWLQWILGLPNSVVGCNVMWYGRQILKCGSVILSAFHRQRIISDLI